MVGHTIEEGHVLFKVWTDNVTVPIVYQLLTARPQKERDPMIHNITDESGKTDEKSVPCLAEPWESFLAFLIDDDGAVSTVVRPDTSNHSDTDQEIELCSNIRACSDVKAKIDAEIKRIGVEIDMSSPKLIASAIIGILRAADLTMYDEGDLDEEGLGPDNEFSEYHWENAIDDLFLSWMYHLENVEQYDERQLLLRRGGRIASPEYYLYKH